MYRKGLPGARVAADGHEVTEAEHMQLRLDHNEPESRQDTNVLQAWGRQQPLSSGRRDSRVPDRSRGADSPGW